MPSGTPCKILAVAACVMLTACAGAGGDGSTSGVATATGAPAAPGPAAPPPAAAAPEAATPAVAGAREKINKLRSKSAAIPAGVMQADGSYTLSEAELALDCKKLTGRTLVRILQIRDYELSRKSSATSRYAQQLVAPVLGGTAYGLDPDAEFRRDRAMVEAYNRRLAEKRCKVFDLIKELQPKPAAETPLATRR